jgi:branched-subunit amino acid aminotransferase/4-amino-4-deoxychorismate lyase
VTSLVLIDGRPMAPDAAKVSVFDRGFLYGDSVFETIRTYGGRPFALERHLARLAESASRVFIDLPVTLDQLAELIRQGEEIRVMDNTTERDLTSATLAQIIFEQEKRSPKLPVEGLRQIIRSGLPA